MKLLILVLIFASLESYGGMVRKKSEPLMEVGMAGGSFWLPHYPGSDEIQHKIISLPYFIYRGSILKSDREGGTRANLLSSKYHNLDLSFSASFPSKSSETVARQGMPDLDWLFEVGPRYTYFFIRNKTGRLGLEIPLRFIYATDFWATADQGYTLQPNISYRHFGLAKRKLGVSVRAGLYFSSERTNQYFYNVDPVYATAQRSAYEARGGFGGSFVRFTSEYSFTEDVTLLVSASNNYFSSAVNKKSSLIRSIENHSFTLGLIWRLWTSDQPSVGETSEKK